MSRLRKYTWEDWFAEPYDTDGRKRIVLYAGKDYNCSQSSICQQIRTAARQRGLLVNIVDLDSHIIVVVRKKPSIELKEVGKWMVW